MMNYVDLGLRDSAKCPTDDKWKIEQSRSSEHGFTLISAEQMTHRIASAAKAHAMWHRMYVVHAIMTALTSPKILFIPTLKKTNRMD